MTELERRQRLDAVWARVTSLPEGPLEPAAAAEVEAELRACYRATVAQRGTLDARLAAAQRELEAPTHFEPPRMLAWMAVVTASAPLLWLLGGLLPGDWFALAGWLPALAAVVVELRRARSA